MTQNLLDSTCSVESIAKTFEKAENRNQEKFNVIYTLPNKSSATEYFYILFLIAIFIFMFVAVIAGLKPEILLYPALDDGSTKSHYYLEA